MEDEEGFPFGLDYKQASRRRVKSRVLTFDWSGGFCSPAVIGQSSPDVPAARGAFTLSLLWTSDFCDLKDFKGLFHFNKLVYGWTVYYTIKLVVV